MRTSLARALKLHIEELEARIAPTVLAFGIPGKEKDQLPIRLLSLPDATQDAAPDVVVLEQSAHDMLGVGLTDGATSGSLEGSLDPAGGPTEAQLTLIAGGDGGGDGGEPSGGSSYVISGVPAYIWYAGCAPTSGGMILGFWDVHGYSNLVVGDASDTSGNITNIHTMMATAEHFADYNGTPDNSEPGHNPHADNCVADFMNTSQSYYGQADGWTSFSYADDGLRLYAQQRGYSDANAWNEAWYSGTLWADTIADINAGYPVLFLVDSDGNGSSDHFITVVGYNDSTMQYAAYNTWDSSVHWYNYTTIGGGAWSVYGATFFRPGSLPQMTLALHPGSDSGVSASDRITNDTTPTFNVTVPGAGTIFMDYDNDGSYDEQLGVTQAGTYQLTNSSAFLDGSHTIRAHFTPSVGSDAESTVGITVDTVAPGVPNVPDLAAASDSGILSTDNLTNDSTPTLDLSGFGTYYRLFRDSVPVTGEYATAASFTDALTPDGSHSYTLQAVDAAGNVSSASAALSVTIDTVAPGVPNVPDLAAASDSGLLSTDNTTNDSTPTLDLSGFGSYYRLFRGATQVSTDYATAASFTEASPLTDGSYSYTLRAVDEAGNLSSASSALSVTVDTVAPAVPNIPDLNAASDSGFSATDNITNDTTPTLDLGGFGTYYRLFRGATQLTGDYATAASFTEASPLTDGSYSYTLRAVDAAGNLSAPSSALSVTVDTVAPAIPNVPDLAAASDSGILSTDNITNDSTPTLDLSGFGSYYRLFRGAAQLTGDYATAASFTEASPLTDGTYSYTLRAVDAAGNLSSASSGLSVTVDTVAPSIPNVPDLNAGSDSGILSTDNITNVATPMLDLSGFGSYYRLFRGASQVSGDYATAASFTEASPLVDGSYSYTLRAVDTAGNLSSASSALSVTIDTVAPSIPNIPDLNAASDSGLSATDNITNDSTPTLDLSGFGTYYRLYRGAAQISGNYATAASFTEASPLTDGSYNYTLRAVDAAGNFSAASAGLSVTIDTVAPSAIMNPAPGAVFDTPPTQLVATFSEAMDPATITSSTFTLQASGGDGTFADGNETQILPASVTYDPGSHAATFAVNGSLANDTYRITLVGSTIGDIAGNGLGASGGSDQVSGFVVGAPHLAIIDSLGAAGDQYLDFGFLAFPAGSGVATVTLANTGPTNLAVSSIALSDPVNYSIAWDGDGSAPTSIAAGAQRLATITLQPTALGAAPATLTVESNDPLQGTATVSLDGTAYVAETWTSGGTTVVVVDAGGSPDLLRENVSVRFGRDGSVSSIRLGGDLPMDGVGILITGAPSVGSITDARRGAVGALSFIVSDAPITNLRLRGPVEGHLLNGRTLEGFSFAPDLDGDGDMRDHSALDISGGLRTLRVSGSLAGDVLVAGSVNNLQTTGAFTGDLLIVGSARTVRIGGDLGSAGGHLSIAGDLNRLSLSSRVGSADLLGDLEVGGSLRNLTVGTRSAPADLMGDLLVTGGLNRLAVSGDVLGAVTVGGDLRTFTAQHIVSAITVSGDLRSLATTSTIGSGVAPMDAVFINSPDPDGSLTVTGTLGKLRQLA